jgi:hypothetical protein
VYPLLQDVTVIVVVDKVHAKALASNPVVATPLMVIAAIHDRHKLPAATSL